jgi:hypothetical protein
MERITALAFQDTTERIRDRGGGMGRGEGGVESKASTCSDLHKPTVFVSPSCLIILSGQNKQALSEKEAEAQRPPGLPMFTAPWIQLCPTTPGTCPGLLALPGQNPISITLYLPLANPKLSAACGLGLLGVKGRESGGQSSNIYERGLYSSPMPSPALATVFLRLRVTGPSPALHRLNNQTSEIN